LPPARANARARARPFLSPARLAALAVGLLVLGTAVYLLDRTPGSAWLIPAAWQAGGGGDGRGGGTVFGALGRWLPSFVHAFAFAVLTALVLPRHPASVPAACVGWALVDTLAEVGQHAAVSAPLAAAIESWLGPGPVGTSIARPLARYFTRGSFDVADVIAGLAGAVVAYGLLRRALRPSSDSSSSDSSSSEPPSPASPATAPPFPPTR